MKDLLEIGEKTFSSRLFLGTGKFSSKAVMSKSISASGSELVTVAIKRVDTKDKNDSLLSYLVSEKTSILPNTSGARNAKEAILMAELAREAFQTNFVKLEIHPDAKYLMPDAIETLEATSILSRKGFVVLPYIHADPLLCKRLEDVGTAAVMPLGAPIGSSKGLKTKDFIEIIVEQSRVPVVVDAGIGRPSEACMAMEIGADAVLVNTAIATAKNPIEMAKAFKISVEAGRSASLNGMPENQNNLNAEATSPLIGFLDS